MNRHEAQLPSTDTIQSLNEWEMVISHRECLSVENYQGCVDLKNEVYRRIEAGTLCLSLAVDGFRSPVTGEVDYSKPSGELYRELPQRYPHLFTRAAADDYRLSIPINKVNLKKVLPLI